MALRLLSGILLARLLGATGYGVYAYAIAWLGLLSTFGTFGLDQLLLREVASLRELGRPGVRSVIGRAMRVGAIGAAGLVASALLALFLFDLAASGTRIVLVVTLVLLPIVVLANIRAGALRGLDRPIAAILPENVLYPGALLLFATAALVWGAEVSAFEVAVANGVAWLVSASLGALFLRAAMPREADPAARPPFAWGATPSLVATAVGFYAISRGDAIVLGAYRSAAEVGVYVAASRVAELVRFMYDAISFTAASGFAAARAAGSRERLQDLLVHTNRLILAATLPLCIALVVFARPILTIFGNEFVVGVTTFRILVVGLFLSTIGGDLPLTLNMTGYHRITTAVVWGGAAAGLLLMLLFVPRFGMEGAAFAMVATVVGVKLALGVVTYLKLGVVALPIRLRGSAR